MDDRHCESVAGVAAADRARWVEATVGAVLCHYRIVLRGCFLLLLLLLLTVASKVIVHSYVILDFLLFHFLFHFSLCVCVFCLCFKSNELWQRRVCVFASFAFSHFLGRFMRVIVFLIVSVYHFTLLLFVAADAAAQ